MAAKVDFEVSLPVKAEPRRVWDLLVDWKAHEEFIPATRVEIETAVTNEVGTIFTATTGFGPMALIDRMRVTQLDWDAGSEQGYCEVEKLGPVLGGTASFRVAKAPGGSTVAWVEDLTIDKLPAALGRFVGPVAGLGFRVVGPLLSRQLR